MNNKEDKTYQTLEESLKKESSDMSLYSGKIGILLLYGLCANKQQSIIDTTLHYVIDSLPSINVFSFSKGLTGIGFGLQYLSDLKILPSDCKKVFQYLDDRIYCDVANNKSTSLSLLSERSVLARATYFYYRVKSSSEIDFYRKLANKECLILLITEIKELFSIIDSNQEKLITQRPEFYLEIGQCFALLYHLLQLDINKNYCQDLLLSIRNFIGNCLEDGNAMNNFNYPFLLRLLYFYTYVAFEIEDKYMKDCAMKWMHNFELLFQNAIKSDLDFCFFEQLRDMMMSNIDFQYKKVATIDSFVFTQYIVSFVRRKICNKKLLEIVI